VRALVSDFDFVVEVASALQAARLVGDALEAAELAERARRQRAVQLAVHAQRHQLELGPCADRDSGGRAIDGRRRRRRRLLPNQCGGRQGRARARAEWRAARARVPGART
jgi:hypothetical protein